MTYRIGLFAAALVVAAVPVPAQEPEVDCNVTVEVEAKIDTFEVYQEVGDEKLECPPGRIEVVRYVEITAEVEASADAEASAEVEVDGEEIGGWYDEFSETGSDSASDSVTEEERVVTAGVSYSELADKGFLADMGTCRIRDSKGKTLRPVEALALVSWLHGEKLMRGVGADTRAMKRPKPKKAEKSKKPLSIKKPAFDGETSAE